VVERDIIQIVVTLKYGRKGHKSVRKKKEIIDTEVDISQYSDDSDDNTITCGCMY